MVLKVDSKKIRTFIYPFYIGYPGMDGRPGLDGRYEDFFFFDTYLISFCFIC
jgi:hypothetical protein